MKTARRPGLPGVRQETELLLWKPSPAWFSVNAFFATAGLRNWYINFEHQAVEMPRTQFLVLIE